MVTAKQIVGGVISAAVGFLILKGIWPVLPKTGVFSEVTWVLPAAAAIIIGLVVIGPGRVVLDTLAGDYWG